MLNYGIDCTYHLINPYLNVNIIDIVTSLLYFLLQNLKVQIKQRK